MYERWQSIPCNCRKPAIGS